MFTDGDSETFRVYVRRVADPEGKQSLFVDVTPKTSFKKFLKLAGKKVGLRAQKCFVQSSGGYNEIKFIDEIKHGEEVVVTEGESMPGADKGGKQETFFVPVLGAGGVGKSACALRFVRDFFVQDWDPTIEDAYRKSVTLDNKTCMLELLDTAGQDDFESLRHQWMMDKDGYVFVYSINSRQSLQELELFYDLHRQINNASPGALHKVPIILVANKKDIVDLDPKERQVSVAEGKKAAERFGAIHIETSAATGENVNEVFETLIREIRRRRAPAKQPGLASRCCIL